jgi:hypothetical protein
MSGGNHGSRSRPERRNGARRFVCFPAHVERPDGATRTAMINDLSVHGALLLVRSQLNVGDRVSLMLYASGDPDGPGRATRARVVRVEAIGEKERGLWTHRVGVQFDAPLADFEDEIHELAERRRRAGL